MSNEKFKVKFGLAVGDTAATIDATTGEVIAALNNDGQVIIGKGATTNGRIDIGNRSRAIAGTPFIDFNSSVNAIDFDVRLIASGGSGTDGQGTLTAYAASIVTAGSLTINSNLQVDGNTILGSNSSDTIDVNGLVTNNISFTDNSTTSNRGVKGSVGANDFWQYGGGATGVDAGYAEIATGDNGTEPIYVRQYTGASVNKELTLLDGSGNTILPGTLDVQGGTITDSTGALQITTASNGNLTLAPNGTGDVILSADTVQVGDSNLTATITTNGTGNLVLNTNNGTNAGTLTLVNGAFTSTGSSISGTTLTIGTLSTGTIQIGQSIHGGTVLTNTVITANISGSGSGSTWTVSKSQTVASSSLSGAGNITLAPITTGDVSLTFANGGNLINDRNYVLGVIRNATTEAAGDIWALNVSASSNPTRGISIDNSQDTTKIASYLARSYGAAAGNRSRLVFERARGTAASPTAVQSGDQLGEVDVTGYSSTGWINDTLTVVPGFFGFSAGENWVSNTALGTSFGLSLAPTATTITTAANLVGCLAINPQVFACRSDSYTWSNGKTGTTQVMALDVSGNLTVTGDIRINGNDIQNSGGTSAITLSSANATTTIKGDAITLENNAGTDYLLLNSTSATFSQPVGLPVKTAAAWNAITGAQGQMVCVSNSAGGSNPNGMIAFWDTTNARWSYIHDNSAV